MSSISNKNFILRHIIFQAILLIFAIFLIVSVSMNLQIINIVDDFVFHLSDFVRNDITNNIFLVLTYFGETITIICLLILLLIFPFRKKLLPLYFLTGISVSINYIIKNLVQRARPVGQFAENLMFNYPFPDSFSFPSGHSQTSMVVYFVLAYILLNSYYNGKHKKLYLSLVLIIPFLVMISRIILGVHFFSDVLMGAVVAIIIISNYVFFEKLAKMN